MPHSKSLTSLSLPDTKFLNYGDIEIHGADKNKRKVILKITLPFILLNTITPVMLGCSKLKDLSLAPSLAIWQPEFQNHEFKEEVRTRCVDIKTRAWVEIEEKVNSLMRTFFDIASTLKDVGDLINVLPLGTYVNITAICDIDKLPMALEELQKSAKVKGVLEFQFALAAALNQAINLIDE